MVLESIVICLDNSEYMRNEDLQPNRMRAQIDAVQIMIYSTLRSNPENCLGIVTMANNQVLAHLTTQEAKLLGGLSQILLSGSSQPLQSLSVSQLVLKHRPFKHAKSRIIVFVGSPIDAEESELINLGKRLKKENISVDIITFGNEPGVGVLNTLVNSLNGPNGKNNSFHTVPTSIIMADYVASSGLVARYGEPGIPDNNDDEDEELRRAIEWSMRESGAPSTIPSTAQPTGMQDGNDLSEDEQLRIALQLSLQEAERMEGICDDQQLTGTRTTANTPEQDSSLPQSAMDISDPDNTPTNATNTTDKTDKESKGPPSQSSNNNHNAANPPSVSDVGKTATETKENKKTLITKKDKNRN